MKLGNDETQRSIDEACELIEKYARDENNRQVSLNYSEEVNVFSGAHQIIRPKKESEAFHELFRNFIGDVHVRIEPEHYRKLSKPIDDKSERSDAEKQLKSLKARQLTKVTLGVHVDSEGNFWEGTVLLALRGNEYYIPLPNKPAFGNSSFNLAFDDSGALTKLKYSAKSGSSDAVTLVGSVATAAQGPSAADQAAALQAEADLIKQRQRLANCQADPVNCN